IEPDRVNRARRGDGREQLYLVERPGSIADGRSRPGEHIHNRVIAVEGVDPLALDDSRVRLAPCLERRKLHAGEPMASTRSRASTCVTGSPRPFVLDTRSSFSHFDTRRGNVEMI